jgi:hypothetical protein
MVERVNGTLGNILTKMTLGTREKWDEFVQSAVFILNARKHAVTGYAPFYLVYGFDPRLPGDTFPPCIYSRNPDDISLETNRELTRLGQHRALALKNSQRNAQIYANSGEGHQTFKIGEFVKLKNYTKQKLQFKWKGPLIVFGIGPHNTYYLKKADGTELKNPHNGIHLAPWISLKELESSNAELERSQETAVENSPDTSLSAEIPLSNLAVKTKKVTFNPDVEIFIVDRWIKLLDNSQEKISLLEKLGLIREGRVLLRLSDSTT